ncbi:hypothetical protein [Nocardioides sp. Kera G14]|uniref:hypothetical protein n=1 Tax=Nocardioides sp. Kera G14 TaxID=2884264 RepID=UPI001D11E2AB|nr:hypothetical protein [Nocardioides sp. Kera G14]UDY22301.1 hypothetical protein LH076_09420 [Nocardioides sp. Kera G14]
MASDTRWGRIETVLAGLIALVLVGVVVVLVLGARALPWDTKAEAHVASVTAAEKAAKAGVLAFLDVDYKDMDSRIAKMKALSTGTFLEQYDATSVDLKAAAQQAQSVSKGTVDHVAVNRITATTAVLLVTARNTVSNIDTTSVQATTECPTAGARCDSYRLVVTLTRTGSGWRISDLAGVS